MVSTRTRGTRLVQDDLSCRLDAVHDGHAHVHEHDVGLQLPRECDGFGAVRRLARDLDPGLGREDHAEARAHERLVIGEQDADQRSLSYGSAARTEKPPLVAGAGREFAAHDRGPLAQPDEPVAGAAALPPAAAVVDDLELNGIETVGDAHTRASRPCVLERVRQRLLNDPVGRQVDAWRQLDRLSLDIDLDRQTRRAELLGQVRRPARAMAAVHGRARRRSHAAVRAGAASPREPARLCARSRRRRRGIRGIVLEHAAPSARLHDDDRNRVGDDVVQLASNPLTLLADRGLRLRLLALEPMLALAPEPDRDACEPWAADDEGAE